jgi:hypothetical protein
VNKMSVHKKLNAARIELQNSKLAKSGNNKFAGYKYFELGDFLPTINTIFNKAGLCGVVSFASDLATLTITDIEDNSQIVITSPMGSAALKGCHEVQNIGAVETYQRRYLWVTAMEIVEHDALEAVTGRDEVAAVKLEPVDVYVAMVRGAKTMAELQSIFIAVRNQVKSDASYTAPITKAKDEMKALFEGMPA